MSEFERKLGQALQLSLPYSNRSNWKAEFRSAAVLVLFGSQVKGEENLLLIKRAEEGGPHSGQIAFPGGKAEKQDQGDVVQTALRETEEEVGLSQAQVRVLGRLPSILTPTRFEVTPVVGILQSPLSDTRLKLDPTEVAESTWIPFSTFLNPRTYRQEILSVGAVSYPIDVFYHEHYRIWGATGSMIKNLVDRFHQLG